jgi:hypothetical protein
VIFGAAYTIWIVNGDLHLLASMASSFIWLFLTSVLWVMPLFPIGDGALTITSRGLRLGFCIMPEQAEAVRGSPRSLGKSPYITCCPSDHGPDAVSP